MKKTALSSTKTDCEISVSELARHVADWHYDCRIRQHSPRTIETRSIVLGKLLWFLQERNYDVCGLSQLRAFFDYLTTGHQEDSGRWGNPQLKSGMRPCTVHMYYGHCRTFFNWLVADGVLESSPMERIRAPKVRSDQVQPFSPEQLSSLHEAARRTRHPKRDEAILLFLLDTGIRATELCSLKMKDVDVDGRRCRVLGKGNKYRQVYFSRTVVKALWQYIREDGRQPDEPLFISDRGLRAGEPLTRYGLRQLIERLGIAAGLQSGRCSPHTFRHTFAVEFLRNGGHIYSLKEMLGHTTLTMVNRYVSLAQADIENQHRQFSPADRLKRNNK